ncbi:MAG: hypothetical protein MZV70_08160 [Desulfobacterales bacterium]|nr:hypothetical protein [Desulfobacterales bacterium]
MTCTFAPEENEAVVSRVLADAPVELEPLELPVPHAPGLTSFEGERFDPRLEGGPHLPAPPRLGRALPGAPPEARRRRPGAVRGRVGSRAHGLPGGPHGGGRGGAARGARPGVRAGALRRGPGPAGGDGMDGPGRAPLDPRRPRVAAGGVESGAWRMVSLGLRAMEFDTQGRPRPTNDGDAVARALGGREWRGPLRCGAGRAVRGAARAREEQLGGLLALRWRGVVVGRGVTTRERMRSEISKAMASDLKGIVDGRGPVNRPPADE